jgi:hypothetical protein
MTSSLDSKRAPGNHGAKTCTAAARETNEQPSQHDFFQLALDLAAEWCGEALEPASFPVQSLR